MSKSDTQTNKDDSYLSREDLIELLLEPLSAQVDQARLQILQKIQAVESLIDILARQVRREIDKQS